MKNVKMMGKLWTGGILSVAVVLSSLTLPKATMIVDAQTEANAANLVLFVEFSDTTHNHSEASYLDGCFAVDPKIEDYWTGDFDDNPWSMSAYLNTISYGQLNVEQIIPQYDATSNTIQSLVLPKNTEYYLGSGDSYTNDGSIMEDAIKALVDKSLLSNGANIDLDNDGVIDNITIVVPQEYNDSQSIAVTSHATYIGDCTLAGKKTGACTIISERHLYSSLTGSGLLIHEYLHTRGLKDLYSSASGLPVYLWDIMASDSCYLQYPLAYFRNYLGWIDIDTITTGQTVTLTAASKAGANDTQAVILKTPYSDSEFFVIEYRKKGASSYYIKGKGTDSYDTKVPGSGIIIYRINTSLGYYDCKGGAPWSTYIFRPGDKYVNGGESASYDGFSASFLSQESGRTSYGSADGNDGLEQGAITYSDNVNSGIVIKNIGSAAGDTITFEVEFNTFEDRQLWSAEISDNTGKQTFKTDFCIDANGNKYVLAQENFYNSNLYLYKVSNNGLVKLASGPKCNDASLHIYEDKIYVAYTNTSDKACLAVYNNGAFSTVYTSSVETTYLRAGVTSKGIVLAYTYFDSSAWKSTLYAYKYDGKLSGITSDGVITSDNNPQKPYVAECGNYIWIGYSEMSNNNKGVIKRYNISTGAIDTVQPQVSDIRNMISAGEKLYLIAIEDNKQYLYQSTDGVFEKVINESFYDSSATVANSIAINGKEVYVAYSEQDGQILCKTVKNGKWTAYGNPISSNTAENITGLCYDDKLYAAYGDTSDSKIVIKSIEIESNDEALIGYSMTLADEICVDFYMYISPKVLQAPEAKMVISSKLGTQNITLDTLTPEVVSGETVYRFTVPIDAKEMHTIVQAKLCYLNKESKIYYFSVKDYVEYINEHPQYVDSDTLAAANAMLSFGYYAQKYFEYDTESLTEDMTVPEAVDFEKYQKSIVDSDSVYFLGASYVLNSTLSLKLYFITDAALFDADGVQYEVQKEGKLTIITFDSVGFEDEFIVYSEDGFLLDYNVFSYAWDASRSENNDLINLCNALYAYLSYLK